MPNDNEDGIEFIGFSHSPAKSRFSPKQPSPVTGITIHIDSPSTDPAKLTFHKTHGPSVIIGRLSGIDAHGKLVDVDDNKALFRCPVVSRSHAKIAFSDSGFAYLIDLSSHHGTFLLQGQAKEPEKLTPETPLRLLDNAKVTFGKTVGKGDEMVQPISVTIQLLHQSPPKTSSIQRTNSGRFSAPVEISDEDSIYNDSDVEEIPPPPPPASIPPPIPTTSSFPSFIPFGPLSVQQQHQEQVSSVGIRALDVIKTLMPQHPPFSRYIPSIPSLSPPGLAGDYTTRDFTPFPPGYTPEYSPSFDEFNQMIENGIEYYDPPAEKDEEAKEKKEEEKKIECKEKDKDLIDCPSPDSNMDLETPAPASRGGSLSLSSDSAPPSRSVSASPSLSREKRDSSPTYGENYIRKYALPELTPGDLSEDEDVLQAVDAAEARDKASQRSPSSQVQNLIELEEEIEKATNNNNAAEEEEEEEDTDAESVSTTFDPFASFHSHSGFSTKDWFGSHEFGPQGMSGTFSVPILIRAGGDSDSDDGAGNTTSTTTTTTTTTTTSPGKTVTTISTTLGPSSEGKSSSPAGKGNTAHPDTLPPITATPAAHQLRALPPLADMRFMGMNGMNGMNDVLCEASVWVDARKSSGKSEEKVEKKEEKVENEVKEKKEEEVKEKEKEKEDAEMLRAEEEEEGEEDAEGVDDDEVDMEEEEEEEEEEAEEEDDDEDDEDDDEVMEDVSELKEDVSRIQGEINKLTTQRKKYKSRFNANVRAVEDRFSSIGSSLAVLSPVPAELKEVKNDLDKLVKDVGDVNERVSELREEMWQVSSERECVDEREKEKEEKEQEVVRLALVDLNAAQREIGRVAGQIGDMKGVVEGVRRDVGGVRMNVGVVETRVGSVELNVGDVKKDVADMKISLDSLQVVTGAVAKLVETRHKEAKVYADSCVRSLHVEKVLMQNVVDTHTEKIENLNREMEGVVHTRFGALSARLDKLQADLDDARDKDEDRSDHFGRRMSLAEKRLDEMELESTDAVESVDEVAARVDDFEALGLDERVSAVEQTLEKQEKLSDKTESERLEAVKELRSLVAEMRQLRDDTQKQMAHDLQSVKAAKELAMVCINKTTQSFSLKRKRDDTVEDAGALSPVGISAPSTPAPTSSSSSSTTAAAVPAQDVIMGDVPEGLDDAQSQKAEAESALQAYDAPPPRKRARKVVSVLARSATIMGVGAVAAWTALAYC